MAKCNQLTPLPFKGLNSQGSDVTDYCITNITFVIASVLLYLSQSVYRNNLLVFLHNCMHLMWTANASRLTH